MKTKDYETKKTFFVLSCFDTIKDKINSLDVKSETIALFGWTEITRIIEKYLKEQGICQNVIYIDNNGQNVEKQNNVFYPSDILKMQKVKILIASSHVVQMKEQLDEMGLKENNDYFVLIDLHQWKAAERAKFIKKNAGYHNLSSNAAKEIMYEILCSIKEICEKNNLRYYLDSGTLIGAVRHKGFIPWDDDIDIIMPVNDAYKLGEILKHDEKLVFQSLYTDDDYLLQFPRVALKDTDALSKYLGHAIVESPIYIDILVIGGLGNTLDEVDYMLKEQDLLLEKWKNIVYRDLQVSKQMMQKIWEYQTRYKYDDSKYVGYVCGLDTVRWYMERKQIEPCEKLFFERDFFSVPKDYDFRLRFEYGDYMKEPTEEEKKAEKHDLLMFDLRKNE